MLAADAWAERLSLRVFQYWDATAHSGAGEACEFETTFIRTAESPFLYWLYADRDHFFAVTKHGASYFGQYTGLLRRLWSPLAAIMQGPVAPGAGVVIPVDNATILVAPEHYIIQDHQHIERVLVASLDAQSSPQTVTVESLLNGYESGARIGEDPQPLIVGRSTSPGGFYATSRLDGYASPTGQPGACYLADGGRARLQCS